MDVVNEFSFKDVIMFIFALGGAWSFIKFSLSTLKGDVKELKEDNEKRDEKVKNLEEKINHIDKTLAVIENKTANTNTNVKELFNYVKSKI